MSTKHTTEPWELVLSEDGEEIHIQSKDGMVAKVDRYFLCNSEENTHEANAQRIVDCVNTLQDVERPLEWRKIQIERIKEITELRQKFNLLLAAAERFQKEWVVKGNPMESANNYAIEMQINEAIMVAKGGDNG